VLQQELLAWKARPPSSRGPPPPPTLLSFTPTPTYTLGRRQTEPLSENETARLQSPLFVSTLTSGVDKEEKQCIETSDQKGDREQGRGERRKAFFRPEITHAPRGGLTTYHGPGQLVLWPVIDLHSPLHAHLSVRDYACLLEKTTIATLRRRWGIAGFTTENPGVWVCSAAGSRQGDERKIAALGVHLRRHVTGLGVAINYSTPVAGPEEVNPWARIVACGLGDRSVTSVCTELGVSSSGGGGNGSINPTDDDENMLGALADTWWSEFLARLNIHENAGTMLRGYDMDLHRKGSYSESEVRSDILVEASPVLSLGA
jgi:lipoyl(octanoyl) transferase